MRCWPVLAERVSGLRVSERADAEAAAACFTSRQMLPSPFPWQRERWLGPRFSPRSKDSGSLPRCRYPGSPRKRPFVWVCCVSLSLGHSSGVEYFLLESSFGGARGLPCPGETALSQGFSVSSESLQPLAPTLCTPGAGGRCLGVLLCGGPFAAAPAAAAVPLRDPGLTRNGEHCLPSHTAAAGRLQ